MKCQVTTRKYLVRTWTNNGKKWGILKLSQSFKVNQSPKPFVVDAKFTYETVEPGTVIIKFRYHNQGVSWKNANAFFKSASGQMESNRIMNLPSEVKAKQLQKNDNRGMLMLMYLFNKMRRQMLRFL